MTSYAGNVDNDEPSPPAEDGKEPPSLERIQLGERIRRERKRAELTQPELQTKLGRAGFEFSKAAVSAWERAERLPDVFVIKQLAKIFGVTTDTLITGVSSCPFSEEIVTQAAMLPESKVRTLESVMRAHLGIDEPEKPKEERDLDRMLHDIEAQLRLIPPSQRIDAWSQATQAIHASWPAATKSRHRPDGRDAANGNPSAEQNGAPAQRKAPK